MPLSRIFSSRTFLFLAVFALISTPALAAIGVSTNSVTFAWTSGTLMPQPQLVQVSGVASFTTSITGTGAGLFVATPMGNSLSVALNQNALLAAANDTHTATLTITSGAETATVTLTLIKGSSITIVPSTTTVQLYDPGVLSQQVTITPSPAVPMSYTTTVGYASGTGGWLSVNPASGSLPGTGTAFNIIASPAGLQAGTHTGTVKVDAGGATTTINVSLLVGGGSGTVTVSPAGMSFAYVAGSGVAPAAQQLTIYAPAATLAGASTSTTTGGTNWLLVNGMTSTGGFSLGAGQSAYLQVSVNPFSLSAGTHYGTVTLTANGVPQASIQVTLNVNSATGVSVSPTTLSFTSPAGANAQSVSVSYSGTQTGLTYNATTSSTSWLAVSPASGAVNSYFYVSVNPTGLIAGTYSGYVTVTVPGLSFTQTISVSLTVGGGGGGVAFGVGPTSLTFNAQSGKSVNSQSVAVYGPSNQYFTATASTTSGAQWLVLNNSTGVTPGTISVGVNTAAAGVGSDTGSIQVNSPSGSAIVYVTLNMQANAVLMANPGSIVITYDPTSGSFSGQNVYLSSSDPNTTEFTYTTASSTSWLASGVFGGTGATDSQAHQLLIMPTVTSLSPGVNSGSITVTGTARNGGGTSQVVIPVTVVVIGSATGSLVFTPTAVTFSANQGVAPAAQSVSVNSATASIFSVSATTAAGGNWLTVSPASGYTPSNLTVTANSTALAAGTYTGTINVTANGVTQQIPVTLTVGAVAQATLSLDSVALNFDYQQGGNVPSPISLGVSSTGSQIAFTAAATVSGGGSWLSVSPTSASTPGTLSVSVNPAGLAAGDYTGTVSVTSSSASNSPQTRSVTLKVRAAPVLSLGVNTLTFNSRDGSVPGTQTFSVASSGDPISFSAAAGGTPWLTVSPASGTTPATLTVSANPAGIAPGSYSGQIVVQGTGGNSSRQTLDVTLVVSAPLPTITRITNAASYREGVVAPGVLVVLFGAFMGPKDLVPLKLDSNGRCSKNLSDVRVLFSGIEAPVVYASADQVSAIVPYSMAGRTTTSAQVEYRGVRSNSVTLDVATTAPGIFTVNSSGSGAGVVLNQDFSLNSNANAAARGSVIIVYATGEGQTVPLGVDGHVNNDPNVLPAPVLPVTATIDGQPAKVLYAGAAPGLVSGVMQVNLEVPVTSGTGNVPLVISAGGASSQPNVSVAVK